MKDCLLVGAGQMSIAYAEVLKSMNCNFTVLGRGQESAKTFETATGVPVNTGSLATQLASLNPVPEYAIVAVNAQYLTSVTTELIRAGVKNLLVEKPAALDREELDELLEITNSFRANVYVAYNRRFMNSVLAAKNIVKEDGGVESVKFDFSEPAHRIAKLSKPERELKTWFYGNSSHVVDLAFSFFGKPEYLKGSVSKSISWHPAAGIFVGHGMNQSGGLISWHANWRSPGRWGIEVMTPKHRLILQPLEKLRAQNLESFAEFEIDLEDEDFKPGLLKQVQSFSTDRDQLKTISDHAHDFEFYEIVRSGGCYHE